MNAIIKAGIATLGALTLAMPLSASDTIAALPGWLAGAWVQADERGAAGGVWADEFWTPPRGGLMIGAARMGDGERIDVFEHTRIVRMPDGTLVFVAQPFGNPASYFPMVASDAQMIEFANPAHDYPQRIRYWRDGKLLKARTSLMDGSQAQEWTYAPMGG
ncbi:MAG: hypothetical protein RLZZ58_427 [Pseudomonadota bacterium]